MSDDRQRNLAQRMSQLALRLQDNEDRAGTLSSIVSAAIDLIPPVEWAGVSVVSGRRVVPEAASHALAAELDELQNSLGEGPCLSAIHEHHMVRITNFGESGLPWPRFTAAAAERGVCSMLALRLFARQETLGALTLYAPEPDAFSADTEILADLIAQHAAVALAGATSEHHLNAALANRDILGQAKGILMHRDRLTAQQAFDLLVRSSQETNLKLIEVARWLVDETERRAQAAAPGARADSSR